MPKPGPKPRPKESKPVDDFIRRQDDLSERLRVLLAAHEKERRAPGANAGRGPVTNGTDTLLDCEVDNAFYVVQRVPTDKLLGLSKRQRQVAIWARLGLTRKLIAQRLGISVRTVDAHLATARLRLGNKGVDTSDF